MLVVSISALVIAAFYGGAIKAQQQESGGGMVALAEKPNLDAFVRPGYNYAEPFGSCANCHNTMGAKGDHNAEAAGFMFDYTNNKFVLSGSGWYSAKHSMSNEGETQNTYCARCHSPMQADPNAEFKFGSYKQIADGQFEAVTCAVCHPSHNSAVELGRRLGMYKLGMDRTKTEAYDVVHEGNEDVLCLNCHVTRHGEGNPAMDLMVVAGVRCIDCHMAVYDKVPGTEVDKRFHDWKVGKNLPYSCGVEGSVTHCHPNFSVAATRAFIPYLREQHQDKGFKGQDAKKLRSAADYLKLWKKLQAQVSAQ